MVDLYTALKLIHALDSDDEIIHLRDKNQIFASEYKILTIREIKKNKSENANIPGFWRKAILKKN